MSETVKAGSENFNEPQRNEIDLPGRGRFSFLRWESDAGNPLLVFCHANGFNAHTYRQLLAPLSTTFRIIAFDHRGQGMTTAPADPEDFEGWQTYGDDLVAFADSLDEPAYYAGHSMGGSVTTLLAAQRPALVRALTLVDPVFMPMTAAYILSLRKLLGLSTRSALATGAARRRSIFDSAEAMFKSYKGRGAFETWPDEFIKDYIAGGTRPTGDGKIQLSCDPLWESKTFEMSGTRAACANVWRAITRVQCPVKVLYAETGSTLRPASLRAIRRRQPGWEVTQVPGTTHFLPMEDPQIVRKTLLAMAGAPEAS